MYLHPGYNITIGNAWPAKSVGVLSTAVYLINPAQRITVNGNITVWSAYIKILAPLTFQVWRPNRKWFTLIGETVYDQEANGSITFNVNDPISVRKGDIIGFKFPGRSVIPFNGTQCDLHDTYTKYRTNVNVHVGGTYFFKTMKPAWNFKTMKPVWNSCRSYSISATIQYYKGGTYNYIKLDSYPYTIITPSVLPYNITNILNYTVIVHH